MNITLTNGVEVSIDEASFRIVWASDWPTLVIDVIKGSAPDVSFVDYGPATYGHTSYFYNGEKELTL